MMSTRTTGASVLTALAIALVAADCSDGVGPRGQVPRFASAAAGAAGVALDQFDGTLGESGTLLIKGFNPTNPHRGDAIIATFFWPGSTNIIDSVTDVLTTNPFSSVGNTYTLVDYVTAGGISMATYVATNVQNFPDAWGGQLGDSILAVRANLSQPVSDGGVLISAYSGVNVIAAQALGAHLSAWGSDSAPATADPGTIPVGVGALTYGVTRSNGFVGLSGPGAFHDILTMSDTSPMKADGEYLVSASAGTVDPQWTWYFNAPSTWLATVLALNPPLHLVFTVQPTTTLPLMTIQPAVQVTATDAFGNAVTSFSGPVTIAIGHNSGLLLPGTLSGTKTVTAVNGVATFADLSIDQPGNAYTLTVTASNMTGAESAAFNIGAF